MTRDEGQDFVRAFVQLVDRSTGSPRRSNPPVIFDRPTSPISANYDIVGFEGYPNGEEDLNVAPKEARLDDDGAGDMHPRLPPQCPTCASRSIAATSVNVAAATRGPASASVAAATPVNASPSTAATTPIAAPPATGLAAAMLPSNTTDTASSTAVTSSAASTTAAVVAPAVTPARVPGPVYARLPLNAPSNAVLPPPHLVDAVYGYHIPGTTDSGPFYVITRGRNIGIFSGWFVFFYALPFDY